MKAFTNFTAILVLALLFTGPGTASNLNDSLMAFQSLTYAETSWEWCPMGYSSARTDSYPASPNEYCDVNVEGSSLSLTHFDSPFNCCIDDIFIEVEIEKDVIIITEHELYTYPCYCYCYFEVSVDIHNLKPGEYRIEVWNAWEDGNEDLRCEHDVTIPGVHNTDTVR